MIESIEIKNFRCFKDTKIAKFGLVNLFGGLNNSGKTTLLEAIALVENPYNQMVVSLLNIRGESHAFIIAKPENAWNSFFYQQNIRNHIEISAIDDKVELQKISLIYDDNINEVFDFEQIDSDKQFTNYVNTITNSKKSALRIQAKNKQGDFSSILIASNRGIGGNRNNKLNEEQNIYIRPPNQKKSNLELALAYEQALFDGKAEIVLKALQIVDKRIDKIDVFHIGEPTIYLTTIDGVRTSSSLFGDTINTVTEIILVIIGNPNITILIDEIENGIHYTVQTELWEMLFKLAIEFNVQIFSTSHSLEMIKAFSTVAETPEFLEKAAYFEMARHYKTGNIIGTSISMDDLKYYIESNSPFRGD